MVVMEKQSGRGHDDEAGGLGGRISGVCAAYQYSGVACRAVRTLQEAV